MRIHLVKAGWVSTTLLVNLFILGTLTALYTHLNVMEHYNAFQFWGVMAWFPH